MRFRASIKNISTFSKLTASLSLLGKVVWIRLDDGQVRFTVIPEQGPGTQVWAVLSKDAIFESYTIKSASSANTINLQVPLAPLQRALRSALSGSSASIRLTKQDNMPVLSLTITVNTLTAQPRPPTMRSGISTDPDHGGGGSNQDEDFSLADDNNGGAGGGRMGRFARDRDATVTQSIPVIVLANDTVSLIHEPRCREPDVYIMLPPLQQLKAISDRFTKLALSPSPQSPSTSRAFPPHSSHSALPPASSSSRLILSATARGDFRIAVSTPALRIQSHWSGLHNPALDPAQVEGGEEGVRMLASTVMREREGDDAWAVVRVEGRDWGRVLGVGRLGGRVVASFCHEHALILYVYPPPASNGHGHHDDDDDDDDDDGDDDNDNGGDDDNDNGGGGGDDSVLTVWPVYSLSHPYLSPSCRGLHHSAVNPETVQMNE